MSDGNYAKLKQGAFVFSLDFELAWGTRGRYWADIIGADLDGTRDAIEGLLALLAEFELSATWVIVGGMLLGGTDRHPWLDGEEFSDVPLGDCRSQPRWYADDILEKIRATTPYQEIGCHTLTHMFVQDTEQSRARFDLELGRNQELFESKGIPAPRSFIFPKHFMAHFDLLQKHGISAFRGPESGWFEQLPGKTLKASGRFLSARLRQSPSVSLPYEKRDGLWVIPSSQFYPSFRSVGKYVSVEDRVAKAIKGLNKAARKRAVYHLWTHPFNLGVRSQELLEGLRKVFVHAREQIEQGRLVNLTMDGLRLEAERIQAERTEQCDAA